MTDGVTRRDLTPEGGERRPARVLIVDDHDLNVELLTHHLDRLGYEVATGSSGGEALRSIASHVPDIVLLDVLMPGMSGLDVLQAIRSQPETADLPVILVSGLGDTEHIVRGLAMGANDYVTKPIDMPILKARLATQTALKRATDELKHTAWRLADELDRKARDLAIAAQVQRSGLPEMTSRFEGLTTAWTYEPTTEVGGDLFDVVALGDGRTLLFVADATGHGVQAALVVSSLRAMLSTYLDDGRDLASLMRRLDDALANLFEDRYVTAAVCVVDVVARTLSYSVAGHPPILLARSEGVAELTTTGLPLGTALGGSYVSETVSLPADSRLLLYTDGLVEAFGPSGRSYGLDALAIRLESVAHETPETILVAIREDLDRHRAEIMLEDDLTILAVSIE